ncbi:histone-lysine N-methyltransferase NSD2-like [Argiope bruennichi]|uniref:histone-lysine N-methyltransferase NSD2-like n=1 Tax=Argiope bruennichi TaxID=94029 RepID=UPI0024951C40|nr:histone-lysine N-methyltransferase NSD2-like [Argiope bruennichi]
MMIRNCFLRIFNSFFIFSSYFIFTFSVRIFSSFCIQTINTSKADRLATYSFAVQRRSRQENKAKRVRRRKRSVKKEGPSQKTSVNTLTTGQVVSELPSDVVDAGSERVSQHHTDDGDHIESSPVPSPTPLDYTPGSLVWAKLFGHPYWPAIIEADPDLGEFHQQKGSNQEYHVVFLDKPPSRSWIRSAYIRSYDVSPPVCYTSYD